MYFPYFRGKQNELITVRESAQRLTDAGFVPIIEPVKESLSGFKRALDAVVEVGGEIVVIVNPRHGDHTANAGAIRSMLLENFAEDSEVTVGILLTEDISIADSVALIDQFSAKRITLVHDGFSEARGLVERLGDQFVEIRHVFLEDSCPRLYRRHFQGAPRILIRDGFQRRTNREHPVVEIFSDLHAAFGEENMDGFGDFLVVGNDFFESGGPAFSVAIHLTFIDSEKDNQMFVYHFKSDRFDTPTDPGGKFLEALNKLALEVNRPQTQVFRSSAVEEFLALHERQHFPGLGYVKKLSMTHHIETLAQYFLDR